LRLWRKQRMEDVQISTRDLVLAALYVADGVEYRRKLHCIFYWIKEEVEVALRNPFCGCKPAWRLEPAGAVLHKYGPYSVAVADELEALKAEGLVRRSPPRHMRPVSAPL